MEYPKNIYMSPRKALIRFSEIMKRCHPEAMDVGRNYRLEKEALIAGEFLYGVEKLNGGKHWFQNGEHLAKDIDVMVVSESAQGLHPSYLQITEFESHTGDLLDVVTKKIKPGYDPGSVELVINIRDKSGQTFYPDKIAESLRELNPPYPSISLVTGDLSDEWIIHVVSLHPYLRQTKYNVLEALKDATPPDWIRETPKYAKYEKAEHEFDLPLPPCPVCGQS